jgi:predicted dithiol-disulfide oxidoreductase (DUF899 family)
MDAKTENLTPAIELARNNPVRIPGESADYRAARTALLAEEIELRRHSERVAAMRRALPPGAPVAGDYRFLTEDGPSDFAGLFGDKDTLAIFNFMFGPQRKRPCPMCTNFLGSLDGNAADVGQQMSLVVVARSPLERLTAFKRERGWSALRFAQDLNDAYFRDYYGLMADGAEAGGVHVFTRRDGTVRHFWSCELTGESADPGQDQRGAPEATLWAMLDCAPDGRGADWYPSLDYGA